MMISEKNSSEKYFRKKSGDLSKNKQNMRIKKLEKFMTRVSGHTLGISVDISAKMSSI